MVLTWHFSEYHGYPAIALFTYVFNEHCHSPFVSSLGVSVSAGAVICANQALNRS
jgi:hypothetical protein